MRFLAAALAGWLAACAPSAEDERPNIVVFLADDVGYSQLGFTGGTEVPTPHIDRLAREGVALDQFYVQPVCSPTPHSLTSISFASRRDCVPSVRSTMRLSTPCCSSNKAHVMPTGPPPMISTGALCGI